jgi:cysteine desulfurase
VRPEAQEAWQRALVEGFANPGSTHTPGRRSRALLDGAREALASTLGARPGELVFTGSGTESDNLAIKGVALAAGAGHIVTTQIEHPAVLESCGFLERECFDVTCVGCDSEGRVSPDEIRDALREDTLLVSVMWVNNETGVIQPVEAIAEVAHEHGALMHTDAVQAYGRLPVRMDEVPIDLLSIAGHKFGAPRGTGALFVRRGTRLEPLLHGGGQERKLRSGTQSVAGALALATVGQLVCAEAESESRRLSGLRDRLEASLLERVPDTTVNGAAAQRTAGTANVRFDGADGEAVLLGLDANGIAASSASACAAAHTEPSYVLMAMGLSRSEAEHSMRFSLGRLNTDEDVDNFLDVIPGVVEKARSAKPGS